MEMDRSDSIVENIRIIWGNWQPQSCVAEFRDSRQSDRLRRNRRKSSAKLQCHVCKRTPV
nr:MAG TPA: hypothetical protein [Caudoviricetes sp.]